jgi:hypothetical protein
MKKTFVPLLILAFVFVAYQNQSVVPGPAANAPATSPPAASYVDWRAGDQVRGSGTVTRVLSDDNDGSRHQRFIVEVSPGRTVLIAHNIDLAPRVASIRVGDTVSFYGEYEWNERGGVIHWTHHDPRGSHVGGWIEHQGRRYE